MPDQVGVVVVDDQPLFASGIAMLIDAQSDMRCIGAVHDGTSALSEVARLAPDVVLMDLRMPGLNGLEVTRALLGEGRINPRPRVVVLTTLRRDDVVVKALQAGASAFLTKDATTEQVLSSIRAANSGDEIPDVAATLDLVSQLARDSPNDRQAAISALSPREREVFLLVARGLSNAEIATASYVSEATVKTHIASILRKLDLRSRVQVVVFAHRHDLVTIQ
ncbi:MAG: response regulator [Rhodoglobus sp.]